MYSEKKIFKTYKIPDSKIFSEINCKTFFKNSNISILILLEFIKSTDWPYKKNKLNNQSVKIPFIWGIFSYRDGELIMTYDIYPTKCFPSVYNKNNPQKPLELIRNGEITLGGCQRYSIFHNNRYYDIPDKTPSYCSVFGIPDDCFNKKFENNLFDNLDKIRDSTIWCYDINEYIKKELISKYDIKFIKKEFLPSKYFFYNDTSYNYLSGIYTKDQLSNYNSEIWYEYGNELINELNINNPDCFRFEEKALYYIKKKMICEFIGNYLLLDNKDKFQSYIPKNVMNIDYELKNKKSIEISDIKNQLELETKKYLLELISQMISNIDIEKFNESKFMVSDVEYIGVSYPQESKRDGTLLFPCIFSNIIWYGSKKGLEVTNNIFDLPCKSCIKECEAYTKNIMDYYCLINGIKFYENQITAIELLLNEYENFKIYTYNKHDIYELEKMSTFFIDSYEKKSYERKNRIRKRRITELSIDLSDKGKSLNYIENEFLMKWLLGWKRRDHKTHAGHNMLLKYNDKNWRRKYESVILTCIDDSISAFLYLIYQKYKKDEKINMIKIKKLSDYI